jgi:Ser/Thr protein kinase RdoA (MazF antagonist)
VKAAPTIREAHPLVPEPIDALEELDLGERLPVTRRLFERVDAVHDPLVGSLPAQIVHGDFAYANVIVTDGRVTAFVDFEFAGPDVRAADLAAAMYVTAVRASDVARWPLLEALAAGYRRSLALDPIEVAAVAELMRRRNAFGIVHWIGRYRQGIASRDAPIERIDRGAWLSRWLDENEARLVATITGELATAAAKPRRRS